VALAKLTPSSRRFVHRHDQHGIADQSLAVITLDLDDITVAGP